jgi:pimeloyl-ACP methyl ester carboxylesterase
VGGVPRDHRISVPLLTILAAVLLLVAACTSVRNGTGVAESTNTTPSTGSTSGSSSTSGPTQPAAQFHDCSQFNLGALDLGSRKNELQFSCAQISVPLNYADPSGQTIPVAMLKVHDTKNTHPLGSLLINPGGPGASGIFLALSLVTQFDESVLTHFDLIGFDPRGVGESSPIKCISDSTKGKLFDADLDIRVPDQFAEAKAMQAAVASACLSRYGTALAQYDTVNTARDMDQIRQAVGDPQLNYLGFSYGTELGAQYAHLFPGKIRVMVLDGAVDPLTDSITSFADQVKGFEQAFDQFAADCATKSSCNSLGNPRQDVSELVAKADANPLHSSDPSETRTASGGTVLTGVLQALYSKSLWPDLANAIKEGLGGDAKGLFALADQYDERFNGTYTNIFDANTAISCNDSKPGPTDAQVRQTVSQWASQYPMFGVWAAQSMFSCQSWQPTRTVPPLPTAKTSTPLLVIGNLHDPATPYQGALDLAKTMGNAQVLSWDGEGHTSYLQGSTCVDNYVNAYLISQTLPPAHTTCPK